MFNLLGAASAVAADQSRKAAIDALRQIEAQQLALRSAVLRLTASADDKPTGRVVIRSK